MNNGENPRLQFDAGSIDDFMRRLRAELKKSAVCAVTVDLEPIVRADPPILRALRTAGEEASRAGKDVYVDRVTPVVYKSLQLAKLGALFKRLHHATATP